MEYRLQSMYNHMVGRTASVVSPFYSLLPGWGPSLNVREKTEKIRTVVFKVLYFVGVNHVYIYYL